MLSMKSLQKYMLIATPQLEDNYFSHAVIYLYQHSFSDGALGFVINKPSPTVTLANIFDTPFVDDNATSADHILIGGPVDEDNIILLHRSKDQDEHPQVIDQDYIKNLASDKNLLKDLNVFLGCTGWQAGQLEQELKNGDWLLAPHNDELLYDTPVFDRYAASLHSIGVKPHQLVPQTGEA